MKRYHIYYLPNAYRTYTNALGEVIEVFGKVGRSKLSIEKRKRQNEIGHGTSVAVDITGHEVIAWARTLEEAKLFEKQYQVCYDCIEPSYGWRLLGIKKKSLQRAIKSTRIADQVCETYDSISDCAEYLGISGQCIMHVLSGRSKTSNGYVFEYI